MNGITFSAEDCRQYSYCPRIIYFRYVARSPARSTYKMKRGQKYHDEKIRRKTQSTKEDLTITYNVFLEAQNLGLFALFDAVASKPENIYYPIEFKTGKIYEQVPVHHRTQLIVQAIILEEIYQTIVRQAEMRYEGEKRVQIPITLEEKNKILQWHSEMLKIVGKELLPEPTAHQGKCRDCEYWLTCRRV